jgi:hypothetical protein
MTQPARPDPARTLSQNDHVRSGPGPSGACGPAQFSVGTLAPHIGTLPLRCTWCAAQGWSGPPAAQRAHLAGSRR